jgi:hypothetical protein
VAEHGQTGLIETALAIAAERSIMLAKIRDLLEAGEELKAIPLMKVYCGMSDDEKGQRTNSRLN